MVSRRGILAACLAALASPLALLWGKPPGKKPITLYGVPLEFLPPWPADEKPDLAVTVCCGSMGDIILRWFPSGRVTVFSDHEQWQQIGVTTDIGWMTYGLDDRGRIRFCRRPWAGVDIDYFALSEEALPTLLRAPCVDPFQTADAIDFDSLYVSDVAGR